MIHIHCFKCDYEFLKREFWIGIRRENRIRRLEGLYFTKVYHLWVCIIPMLSLHISWQILEKDEQALKGKV